MSGCWRGKLAGQNGTIEERYNPAAGGLMLGTSQVVVDGRTAFFEFIKIEQSEGGIVMTPAPKGKPSVPFKMVSLDGKKAVFENLEHDFPKRIVYQLRDNGSLVARIEGDKPEQSEEFVMEPIPCGTANLVNFSPGGRRPGPPERGAPRGPHKGPGPKRSRWPQGTLRLGGTMALESMSPVEG